jgi:hypothetical protein
MKRAVSVVRPKALTWFMYWERLPGKTATKNAAVATPTHIR